MNILAIGAGLTGCHFASEAQGRGHQVVVYDMSPNEAYVRHVAGDVTVLRWDVRDIPALAGVRRDHAIDAR